MSGLSCPEDGGCKSAIFRGSPYVFSLFGPCKVGEISFMYSWTTGMKKKLEHVGLLQYDVQFTFCINQITKLLRTIFDSINFHFATRFISIEMHSSVLLSTVARMERK